MDRYSGRRVAILRTDAQATLFSTDHTLGMFLAFLADEQVSPRTARLYLAHVARFGHWLREQYQADLLEATSHDLRAYRTQLAVRQKPASANAALAALHRFYAWAAATRRLRADGDRVVYGALETYARYVESLPSRPRGSGSG